MVWIELELIQLYSKSSTYIKMLSQKSAGGVEAIEVSSVTQFFKVVEDGNSIEVEENNGNSFQLGPILRKYTSAKMTVKPGGRRLTTVETHLIYDALGLLRSLRYDLNEFNSVANRTDLDQSDIRYACYRLTRQASALGVRMPRAGSGTVSIPGLDELMSFVEARYKEQIASAQALISGGVVDFQSLAEFFTPGVDLLDRGAATGLFGVPTAMRVRAGYYSRGKSLFGVVSSFYAAIEFVVSIGEKFAVVESHFPIGEFHGTRSTREGLENFVVLSDRIREDLVRRGQLYASMTGSNAYLEYSSGCFLPVSNRGGVNTTAVTRARGGGRIMVDSHAAWVRGVHCARSEGAASNAVRGVLKLAAQRARTGALQQAPDQYTAGSDGQTASTEEESLDLLLLSAPLPSKLLHLTWPVVAGFSFQAKSWGVVMVSGLREVTFNDKAFQKLVMPTTRKRLIEALVLSHQSDAQDAKKAQNESSRVKTDIIAGKGEGTIFLLHGPPGVGKTLTAEAIAELLCRPLYVVSMGELGTSPETLEERLLDIFDLCIPWSALVLIDEAEMLLEARTKSDVLRNAMVCVMLRLLEYYTGILFLTTNRIESLDPAFQSRVQCALRYEPLDQSSREQIWRNLMEHSKIEFTKDIDLSKLARHELNGRQIKNVLQLAVALSRQEKIPLQQHHLDTTIEITKAFVQEVATKQ
jgi:hypothetical protein